MTDIPVPQNDTMYEKDVGVCQFLHRVFSKHPTNSVHCFPTQTLESHDLSGNMIKKTRLLIATTPDQKPGYRYITLEIRDITYSNEKESVKSQSTSFWIKVDDIDSIDPDSANVLDMVPSDFVDKIFT